LESAIGVLSEEAQMQLRHSDALHMQLQEMRDELEARVSSVEASIDRNAAIPPVAPPKVVEAPPPSGGLFGVGGGLVESFSSAMRELQRLAPKVEENSRVLKELLAREAEAGLSETSAMKHATGQLEEAKSMLQEAVSSYRSASEHAESARSFAHEALLVRSDVVELAEQAQICMQEVELSRRDSAEQVEQARRVVDQAAKLKLNAADSAAAVRSLMSEVAAVSARMSALERTVGPVRAAREGKAPLYFSLEQADNVRETSEKAQRAVDEAHRAVDEVVAVEKRVGCMEKRILAVESCCVEVAGVMRSKVVSVARQALETPSPSRRAATSSVDNGFASPGKVLAMDEECLDLAHRVARSEEALRRLLKQLENKVTTASDMLLPPTSPPASLGGYE